MGAQYGPLELGSGGEVSKPAWGARGQQWAQASVNQPSPSSRTTWTWLRLHHLTPCFMMMASQRRKHPWWTVIMLPSLEPSPPRGLKTNSMVDFHMHLLDSSNIVPLHYPYSL